MFPKSNNYKDQISFVDDKPGNDFRYAIDNLLIFDYLDWEPKYSFEEALKLTIQWYLENLNWSERFSRDLPL